jgi:CBS domain-containing protein
MIPGMPLDGGRVLRALWWFKSGNQERATWVASEVGRAFALFLILLGFLQMAAGNYVGGLWSILIGVFLRQAAGGSYKQLVIQKRLETIKIENIITTNVLAIPPDISINTVMEDIFFTHHFMSYPVTEGGKPDGVLLGLLTLNHIRALGKDGWEGTMVDEIMDIASPETVLSHYETALDALNRMNKDERGRYPVERGGRLIGMLTRRDIMKTLQMKMEFEKK